MIIGNKGIIGSANKESIANGQVLLTFPDNVPANTAINIKTGDYLGGSAVVEGDQITLPNSPSKYKQDPSILPFINGLLSKKGENQSDGGVYWISATQVAVNHDLFLGNELYIRV